jgi:hypothetical protein
MYYKYYDKMEIIILYIYIIKYILNVIMTFGNMLLLK